MNWYVNDSDKERNLHLKSMRVFLQTVWENSHKIVAIFELMIKRIFVKNCCSSDSFIDNFKNLDLVILSHYVLPRDTVTERDLTRLSKSTDKKGSDLPADNFHCFFSNRHMKNIQRCTYVLKKADLNLILWFSHKVFLCTESI